jgi:hypothetical protein
MNIKDYLIHLKKKGKKKRDIELEIIDDLKEKHQQNL